MLVIDHQISLSPSSVGDQYSSFLSIFLSLSLSLSFFLPVCVCVCVFYLLIRKKSELFGIHEEKTMDTGTSVTESRFELTLLNTFL